MKNFSTLIEDGRGKSKNLGKKKFSKLVYKMADCKRLIQKRDIIWDVVESVHLPSN